MIEAVCPCCKMIFLLKNDMQGKSGTCNLCKSKFSIPGPLEWEDLSYLDVAAEIPPTEISSRNPTCIVFLIDHSNSMEKDFRKAGKRKDCVADVMNRFLYNLVMRCMKGDGIYDYFYVAIYGYGGKNRVTDLLEGLREVSWVAYNTKSVEKRPMQQKDAYGKSVMVESDFPIWITPVAEGETTPMTAALKRSQEILSMWVEKYPLSFPPIVINITDGVYSDENPRRIANEIKKLRTRPGKVMLMNCHISGGNEPLFLYPNNDGMREEDGVHRLLYEISSVLPKNMVSQARQKGCKIEEGARGFAFNADLVTLIDFLDIGTPAI